MNPQCPFCGHDPYEYVHNGLGYERVAVTCCELGVDLIQYHDVRAERIYYLLTSSDKRKRRRGQRIRDRILN